VHGRQRRQESGRIGSKEGAPAARVVKAGCVHASATVSQAGLPPWFESALRRRRRVGGMENTELSAAATEEWLQIQRGRQEQEAAVERREVLAGKSCYDAT